MTLNDFFNIRQKEGETIKQYMARYGATSVKVEDSMPDACAQALKNGLRPGSLNNKLGRKLASSMAEVWARTRMYIFQEEDDAFKCQREKMN